MEVKDNQINSYLYKWTKLQSAFKWEIKITSRSKQFDHYFTNDRQSINILLLEPGADPETFRRGGKKVLKFFKGLKYIKSVEIIIFKGSNYRNLQKK